jgi:DNA-binding transcriptional MerR regulator
MTIGQLSRRTSVPIKTLREYERLGFLYTLGRSESNYRLFGEEALWCVRVVQGLRALGLTLKEIQNLVAHYLADERAGAPREPADVSLEEYVARALARVDSHIADLQTLRQHICDFQAAWSGTPAEPTSYQLVRLLSADPRHRSGAASRWRADAS